MRLHENRPYGEDEEREMTQQRSGGAIDWREWLRRWDRQQTRYLPFREERFNAMFDALEALLPTAFVALDLGCGPGSLSQRLLARFPNARAIAIDQDPLLLAMGQGALGDIGGRLRWIDANLREPSWREQIGVESVDVALSTTALHWLPPDHLVRLYTELGTLIRPDGLFLNGDHMADAPGMEPFARVRDLVNQREEWAAEQDGAESWRGWWDAVASEPALAGLVAERERRLPESAHGDFELTYELHVAALGNAGFRSVGVLWQRLDDRVLLAVR
jgi:trans-aconitate methyltransferase